MDENSKRKLITKYFQPFPQWTVWAIIAGLFLTIAYGLGLILIGLSVFFIYKYYTGNPTDAEIDAWLEEDLKSINKASLIKLNVDESELIGETVEVTGPKFWDLSDSQFLWKQGKDNILRYSVLGVSLLNFTPNQLLSYYVVLDLTTGKASNVNTDEYFYKDVVSVSTKTESKIFNTSGKILNMIRDKKKKDTPYTTNSAEYFTLTTSGGTAISLLVKDETLIKKLNKGTISMDRTEKAVQNVRKMIRDKKG